MASADYDEAPVQLNVDFSNLVIVDGLPIATMDKFEKLLGVIRKAFSEYGEIAELNMPTEEGKTVGYGFIEYKTPDAAKLAISKGDGRKLDAKHTFRVSPYEEFDRLLSMPTEYVAPQKPALEDEVLSNWLLDPRDQLSLRFDRELQIHYCDPIRKPSDGRVMVYGGEREKSGGKVWTEGYTKWSPKGDRLVTFHRPGVAFWGKDTFEKLARIPHQGVNSCEFSPNEKYVITGNGREPQKPTDPEATIIWDVRTQTKLRGFNEPSSFRWSHDDKFFARLSKGNADSSKDALQIYETPLMGLLDKKSHFAPLIQDFAWAPTSNLVAYWCSEKQPQPASVSIMQIPSRTIVKNRHLYSVQDVSLSWSSESDYLAAKMLRKKNKNSKKLTPVFEIFRVKERDCPIEVIEFPEETETIISFAWEPKGSRFAVLHGSEAAAAAQGKVSLSVYQIKGKKIELLKRSDKDKVSFTERNCGNLLWSPLGSYLALVAQNGQIEFFDMDSLESLATAEHYNCSDAEWDPSGRYLLTTVTQPIEGANWKSTIENGYRLWNVLGQLLVTCNMEKLYQVLWRPRPATLLSKEQLADLRKSLKDRYWRRFEQEDDEIRRSQLSGKEKEREEIRQKWKQYRQEKERELEASRKERIELRNGLLSDDENDYIVQEQPEEIEMQREEEILA